MNLLTEGHKFPVRSAWIPVHQDATVGQATW
jgi:hypothetical protein